MSAPAAIASTPPSVTTARPAPAPVVYRIATKDPVIFITMDDGWVSNRAAKRYLLERKIPTTQFLLGVIWKDGIRADFFSALTKSRGSVGSHTFSHTVLSGISFESAKRAICRGRDLAYSATGIYPRWLRPPTGKIDYVGRQAAAACGQRRIVLWSASADGQRLSLASGKVLRAGDIVLLHWNSRSLETLQNIMSHARAQGLKVGRLADYLTTGEVAAR